MKMFWKFVTNSILLGLALIIFPALIVFIARESFLWQGLQGVKKDLRAMNRLATAKSCEEEFGLMMAENEQMYRQLRFTSPRAYMLELICPGFPDQPLVQEQRVLSSFISKMPGSAGIIQRTDAIESYIGLVVFQELVKGLPENVKPWLGWISRGELIGLSATKVVTKPLDNNPTRTANSLFGVGPTSTCEGFGFSCCDAQTQYGMGDGVIDVPSCPGNCYARCISRPLVVSWRSSPMPDWDSDVVEVPTGSLIEVFYVLEDTDESGPWTATVDFGDGQQATANGKNGSVAHTYSCPTGICEYTASVTVENARGARSAETDVSKIKVRISALDAVDSTLPNMFEPPADVMY